MKRTFLTGAAILGCIVLIIASYAWYNLSERSAETDEIVVMKPYRLSLTNPSETDVLQLSIGSLLLNETKQIIFCVNNGNEENAAEFDYQMELIYTDNLALEYRIYELEEAEDALNAYIVAEDIVVADGKPQAVCTYWNTKSSTALIGQDVSLERHGQVGLNGEEVNRGTYFVFDKDCDGEPLHLSSDEEGERAQYFVMEIKWQDGITSYQDYEKETDMIYLMVEALQPKPEKMN